MFWTVRLCASRSSRINSAGDVNVCDDSSLLFFGRAQMPRIRMRPAAMASSTTYLRSVVSAGIGRDAAGR